MLETTASETGELLKVSDAIALKVSLNSGYNRNAEAAVCANEVMGMGLQLISLLPDCSRKKNEN